MEFLNQFSEWSTSDVLEVSPQAFEDAKHSYIDTIACILAGKKHLISKKLNNFNINFNPEKAVYGKALEFGAQSGIVQVRSYLLFYLYFLKIIFLINVFWNPG